MSDTKNKSLLLAVENIITQWYKSVQTEVINGKLTSSSEIFCSPKLAIYSSPHHYIIELTGSHSIRTFKKLITSKKVEKILDSTSHLNGGTIIKNSNLLKACIRIDATDGAFSNIDLLSSIDYQNIQSKLKTQLLLTSLMNDSDVAIIVGENATRQKFVNCNLIRADKFKLYYRKLSAVLLLKKKTPLNDIVAFLKESLVTSHPNETLYFGIHSEKARSLKISQELLSLANQSVHETIIDKFLADHAVDFSAALGYKRALSNVTLKIIDGEGWDKTELIPDYLLEKHDGSYDILDLKLGLIDKTTTGKKSRLSLSAYTNKLVSQLNGYKKYFSTPGNCQWAKDNHRINIGPNVLLIGIIGNQNSFFREEINEALEVYKENILLFSYNELNELLRKL